VLASADVATTWPRSNARGSEQQLADRARGQDFVGRCKRADTCGDLDGDVGDTVGDAFAFAGVDAGPNAKSVTRRRPDRHPGADGARRRVGEREDPVAGCVRDMAFPTGDLRGSSVPGMRARSRRLLLR
jgi:hypothetical protein